MLPSGSQVIGTFSGTLQLLEAEAAGALPKSADDSRTLPDGGSVTSYTLGPARHYIIPGELEPHMLTCSYGTDQEALDSGSTNVALLLIPLPSSKTARCELVRGPSQEGKAGPLETASCEIQAKSSDAPEARAFLERVYARYESSTTAVDTLGKEAPQLFSAELLELIRKDQQLARGEIGLLDHDPLCACQDSKAFRVQSMWVVATDADRASAKVMFSNAGQVITVSFNLLREASGWRIDNLAEPSVPRVSLARFLRDGLQQPAQ